MKYQLILQWPASSIRDYDAMIAVENLLIEALPEDSDVDGHDAGSGEVNIFIGTHEPIRVFDAVKSVLAAQDLLSDARIAFREASKSQYTILWPKGLKTFKVT
jgi:hypothetical protein